MMHFDINFLLYEVNNKEKNVIQGINFVNTYMHPSFLINYLKSIRIGV